MPANVVAAAIAPADQALHNKARSIHSREALLLCLGLGLSTSLYLGVLGLRWPVLLTGLLPPSAALLVAQRRQRRLQSATPAAPLPSLLDPSVMRQQLLLNADLPDGIRNHWRLVSERLEALRALAAHCVELDPSCSVTLLVLLERHVDRATTVGRDLVRLHQAPTAGAQQLYRQRLEALQQQLQAGLAGLGRSYEAALEDNLRCPEVPAAVLLSPSFLEP